MDDSEVQEQIRASDPALAGVSARVRENTGEGRVAIIDTPMQTASKLAEVGRVNIGWSLCRIKRLERRKPRCQRPGNLKADCRATEAERRCFRCRRGDHLIKDCPSRPPDNRPSISLATRTDPLADQGSSLVVADHPATAGEGAGREANAGEGRGR